MLPTPPVLLTTKLYRPAADGNTVVRPALLARLHAGLSQKLTLFSAPPGFGKTTLASQWLAGCGHLTAWLSLDQHDNQPAHFLHYFIAAIRTCAPEACPTTQSLLTAGQLPTLAYLTDSLMSELSALTVDIVLVLDDYHHIRAGEVHGILRHLLRYLPANLHLVILTRFDPPLHLGQLRVEQKITELRAGDLRFKLEETRQFLARRLNQSLTDQLTGELADTLQARTEGWITGLQLASLSLQHQAPQDFLAHFHGSDRRLAGYLMEEVMAHLPQTLQSFLMRVALVDRFCAPLADALIADSPTVVSSWTTIADLEALNLFVVPLDNKGYWYRFHDLFRDFLRHQLQRNGEQNAQARLHQQASAWFAQTGLIEDAVRHALLAGDETRAAAFVEANLHPLLNQKVPAAVLARWLALFPVPVIQAHPGLLIAQLYLFIFRWDLASVAATVDHTVALVQADRMIGAEGQHLRLAVLDAIRGYLLYWQGEAQQAIPLFQRSLNHLKDPVAYSFTVAQITQFLALAYANCGQQQIALSLLRPAITEATAHHQPVVMIFLGARTTIQLYAGELAEAATTAKRMLATADLRQAHPAWASVGLVQIWRGWAHYFLGSVCYEQDDLEAAAQHWQQVEGMRYHVNPGTFYHSLTGLALTAQAQGEVVRALAYAQAAREFAIELQSPSLLVLAEVLEVRLTLLSRNPTAALRRAQEIPITTNQGNSIWLEPPYLTVLRARLSEAAPAALTTGLQQSETWLKHAENAHNLRQIIQCTVLQALIWRALRCQAEAFAALDRALTLAEPGGFVRTFLDLGVPLAELLQQFDRQRGRSPYRTRLLAAFAKERASSGRNNELAQHVQIEGITPLTPRELELLTLISQRRSIAEIAVTLVISPNTVKKHTNNIYSKLGVRNRRAAVTKAQAVGLLTALALELPGERP